MIRLFFLFLFFSAKVLGCSCKLRFYITGAPIQNFGDFLRMEGKNRGHGTSLSYTLAEAGRPPGGPVAVAGIVFSDVQ